MGGFGMYWGTGRMGTLSQACMHGCRLACLTGVWREACGTSTAWRLSSGMLARDLEGLLCLCWLRQPCLGQAWEWPAFGSDGSASDGPGNSKQL
eukprot:364345-Chlamydomonas_euryale.AAC.5